MQALILAGGEGTRLRPLTSTVPKPVVPLVDRPFAAYLLEWLSRHGVDDVVMSCGFLATGVQNVLGDGSRFGPRLRYVEEPHPLGTGGAVKLAEPLLDERFVVLNGDVLTDLDLSAQIAQHASTGARATIALIDVADPTGYGLVRLDEAGAVVEFLEKPSSDQVTSSLVSAGAYVLEREVLAMLPSEQNVSIERELFPRLVGNRLYGYEASGYWLDIGTPQRYLQATFDILEGNVDTAARERLGDTQTAVDDDAEIAGRVVPPALVEAGCRVDAGAQVGGRVVLGRDVSVGSDSRVERAVLLQGAEIGGDCSLSACIIGAGARIGDGCTLQGGVVLGEGVTLGARNVLSAGARLFPGISLPEEAIAF
jgi:mannose-1-phosphate guanylyltransferase